MTTKQKFIEDAKRAGITDPAKIVEKANEYREKFGEFEPEKKEIKKEKATREIPEESLLTKGFQAVRKAMAYPIALARTSDQNLGTGGGPNQTFQQNLEDVQNMRWSGGEDMGFLPKMIYGTLTDPASLATGPMGASYKAGKGILGGAFQAGKQALKEGAVSAGIHQTENTGKGEFSFGGLVGETGLSTLLGGGIKLGTGTFNAIRKPVTGAMADMYRSLSKLGGDLGTGQTTKSGFKLTAGQVTPNKLAQAVEFEAQSNPFLADIPQEFNQQNRSLFNQMMTGNIKKIPMSLGQGADPAMVGKNLEDAVRFSKDQIGESYKIGSDFALDPIAGKTIPLVAKKGSKGVIPQAKSEIDNILYKYTSGPAGSERISENAINLLSQTSENLTKYRKPQDLLNLKRTLGNKIYEGQRGEVPLYPSRDNLAFNEMYASLSNAIGQTFDKLGDNAKPLREVWDATNKRYSIARNKLSEVSNTLGVESPKVKPEDYMKRIGNIGGEKLKELRDLAKDDPDLKPVFDEIQGAFFDNFLNRTMNKSKDDFSFDKMISEWNGMSETTKEAMIPKKVIENMNEIIDVLSKQKSTDMWTQNPSGTAIRLTGSNVLKNPKEWVLAKLMRGPIKEYYEKGHVDAFKTLYQVSKGYDKVLDAGRNLAEMQIFKKLKGVSPIENTGFQNMVRQGVRDELDFNEYQK